MYRTTLHTASLLALAPLAIGAASSPAKAMSLQDDAGQTGAVERIVVHGDALEGNLSGDSPDRDVSVYLPPSYETHPDRRYPVLYMLHGYTDTDAQWMGLEPHWIDLSAVIDQAIANGDTREMIVVMPNAYTRFHGSMYSSSVTTGNWEGFVAIDLVAYIDTHYRTIPQAASRGLAGHSMGGYGAMRIGMKNPDVFSAIYLLSPCCMAPRSASWDRSEAYAVAEAITDMEAFEAADFGTKAIFASSAAWAPNPNNPPFFIDLPSKGGELQPLVHAKFTANAPLALIDQYVANLRKLAVFGVDAGDEDRGIATTVEDLHGILTDYDLPHEFEIYEGDHLSGVAERIETKVLPLLSRTLAFEPPQD